MSCDIKKLGYYPGCTLQTKAKNLQDAALASMKALGIEFKEIDTWYCCGAVFSLADDDLIHHVASVRNLVRAQEEGMDAVVTLCSQCYNTLARANLLMREDEEKLDTINRFMDEEPDYRGGVEVMHLLTYLRDHVGWDKLKEQVKVPLTGLKVAPFYGCTLVRPEAVSLGHPTPEIFQEFLQAIGAEPVEWEAQTECCGSYQVLINPEAEDKRASGVLRAANRSDADAMALSCPLCEYNLGTRQKVVLEQEDDLEVVPTYYFTQLLATALGLDPEICRFELNGQEALELLKKKEFVAVATA
jgi:heterodisulfide reductase subunit B